MIPLALFDLDNTLVDRQAAFERWARGFVAEFGLPGDAVAYLIDVDEDGFATREQVFEAARARYALPDPVDALIAAYRETYLEFFEPDPPVGEALEKLRHQGWRVGIVTNGPPTQRLKVERSGLADLVDATCISDVVGVAKPDRRIFEEAVRRCVTSPSQVGTVWMVGDSATPDIAGGAGAGLATIWMHRGRDWERSDYRPDATAATIAEAVEIMVTAHRAPAPA
jgi:putative hydrolase of the HAD superfamily